MYFNKSLYKQYTDGLIFRNRRVEKKTRNNVFLWPKRSTYIWRTIPHIYHLTELSAHARNFRNCAFDIHVTL